VHGYSGLFRADAGDTFFTSKVIVHRHDAKYLKRLPSRTKQRIKNSLVRSHFENGSKISPMPVATMNLFRSEEHIRNWTGFEAGTEEDIIQLVDEFLKYSIVNSGLSGLGICILLRNLFAPGISNRPLTEDYCRR